jgi:hypothetical protein
MLRTRQLRWSHAARVAALLAALTGSAVQAQEVKLDRFYVQTSLYTKHFNPDPRHNSVQYLIDVEWHRPGNWLFGASFFRNSFDQPSQYVFFGKQWRPFDSYPLVHVKLTAGILHGYKGEFRDKIPFNSSGFAPVILPSIGLSGKRFGSEIIFFGISGAMLTAGVFIDP